MTDFEIRCATRDDIAGIQKVGLVTWPGTYLDIAGPQYVIEGLHRWWSEKMVEAEVEAGECLVAVRTENAPAGACPGSDVIGTVTLGHLGGDSVLWKIYVLPQMQGEGVGSRLLQAALDAIPVGTDLLLEYVEGNEPARPLPVRWILLHVLRELAQHCGHADILREQILASRR